MYGGKGTKIQTHLTIEDIEATMTTWVNLRHLKAGRRVCRIEEPCPEFVNGLCQRRSEGWRQEGLDKSEESHKGEKLGEEEIRSHGESKEDEILQFKGMYKYTKSKEIPSRAALRKYRSSFCEQRRK